MLEFVILSVFGDFNEVLRHQELTSSDKLCEVSIEHFREVIMQDCGLSDMGYVGPMFTFSNRRKREDEFKGRLDRLLTCEQCQLLFPKC